MSGELRPKRGMRFLHARQITRDGEPMTCEVTRITSQVVYFRNATGFRSCVARDHFPEAVRSIIEEELTDPKG